MKHKLWLCCVPMVTILTGCNTISTAWDAVSDESARPIVLAPTKKIRFAPKDTQVDHTFVTVATQEEVKEKERLAQVKEEKRQEQENKQASQEEKVQPRHAVAQYEVVIYDQPTDKVPYTAKDLQGVWRQVYPKPISGATGWTLQANAKARTWGRGEMALEGWRLQGRILKVRGQVTGMSFGIPFIEEFRIQNFDKDTLTITQGARRIRFVREK